MSRIEPCFRAARSRGEGVLVAYLTGGDPDLQRSAELLLALQEGGADVIEVGLPFSDPTADGPVIQGAMLRALRAGVRPRDVLGMLEELRPSLRVPVVVMGYCNTLLSLGEGLPGRLARAGVDGLLAVDLPPEEAGDWPERLRAEGLDMIFLLAPTSTPRRVRLVAERASGFVYLVSVTGTTGERRELPPELPNLIERLKADLALPLAVGFGVSSPSQVAELVRWADGVVVGSALVRRIGEHLGDPRAMRHAVRELTRALKEATRGVV